MCHEPRPYRRTIDHFWYLTKRFTCFEFDDSDKVSYLWPRDPHTVLAAVSSNPWLHTVPHSPRYDTSSLPSYLSNHLGPSTNLYDTDKTVVILKAIYENNISRCICILDMLTLNLLCSNISHQTHESCHAKNVFWGICTVWSGHSLSANRITGHYKIHQLKVLLGWDLAHVGDESESANFTHAQRHST